MSFHLSLRATTSPHAAPSSRCCASPWPSSPAVDLGKQRPFREDLESVQPLQGIAAQQQLDGRTEDLSQLEVDAPDGPVEVNLRVEVEPRAQEHVERLGPMRVKRQASLGDEGVMDDPLHVDRAGGDATYIRVARDVVHVVGRVRADQRGLQGCQPRRRLKAGQLGRADQVGDPSRVDLLSHLEVGCGRSAERRDLIGQRAGDQRPSDDLMVDAPRVEVVLVEEVTERAMARRRGAARPCASSPRRAAPKAWHRRPRSAMDTGGAPIRPRGASSRGRAGSVNAPRWRKPTTRSAAGGCGGGAASRPSRPGPAPMRRRARPRARPW